jgi:DNA-binding response OmpR family regulator
MTCRVLVVEDEIFVATELESVVQDMGLEPVGIAADQRSALALANKADIALIDLNLHDGPTGLGIGRILAQTHGVTVLYITANPSQLGDGVPGTIGVLSKPISDSDLRAAISYAVARRQANEAEPPQRLRLFDWQGMNAAQ